MFVKSLKIFFKNPIITLPNIIFLVIYKVFFDWYMKVSGLTSPDFANEIQSAADIQKSATLIAVFLLVLILSVFISALITSWSGIMCKHAVDGEPLNLFEALKESLKFYWRILGVLVLLAAIFVGISIIFILACFPVALNIQNSISAKAVILFVIIFIVFFLVIIFLSICFTPVQMVLIYDNIGIGESISKGFKFGLKKFFPILGVMLLLIALSLIITVPLQFSITSDGNQILSYLSSLLTTYLGMFTVVYIMNSYKNNKPSPTAPSPDLVNVENANIFSNENSNDDVENANDFSSTDRPSQEDKASINSEDPPENKTNFRI